jgi:hypothetical protein
MLASHKFPGAGTARQAAIRDERFMPETVRGTSRYDKQPSVVVPGPHRVWKGLEGWQQVDRHASDGGKRAPLVAVDTYPGVDLAELAAEIRAALPHYAVIKVEDAAAKPIREIDRIEPDPRPRVRRDQPPRHS